MKLHHIAIICSNYERSKKFYTEVLCFTVVAENYREHNSSMKLDLISALGLRIELFHFPKVPPRQSYPEGCGARHIAFSVPDLVQTIALLKNHGVTCEPIRIDPYTAARFTFFADPDGLPLELYEELKASTNNSD